MRRRIPRLAFVHLDDVPWQEVLAQLHGKRRVSVREKFLEWTEKRMVSFTRYDPGLVIEHHGHASDHLVFVLEGHVDVGDRPCPAGTLVVLERGAKFGPLAAGTKGATLLEVWMGDPSPVPADPDAHAALLRAKGIVPLPRPSFIRPKGAPRPSPPVTRRRTAQARKRSGAKTTSRGR